MGGTPGFEWPATLDVAALQANGWNPVPFLEFVVKIHSRCDLACDYCYMYEMADQSWQGRPVRMSREIAEQTALRIGEHARAHQLPNIRLILHGGEPLLAGPTRAGWRIRWSSEDPRYGGAGTPDILTDEGWRVPAEAAVVLEPAP